MLNKFLSYAFIFFYWIIISCSHALAYESDSDKPIFLESDSAKWDEESQKSTYRGNVVVTQAS